MVEVLAAGIECVRRWTRRALALERFAMTVEGIRQIGVDAAGRVVDRLARIDVVTLKRIVVVGVLLRVVLLVVTSGSNDIFKWEKFGRHIAEWGVVDEYRKTPRFNHPPLMGLWGWAAVWVADHTVIPFHTTFKLLPFAADLLGLWLIWSLAGKQGGRLHAWRAAAVFSTCLTSIVVTGHHGNTDSACSMLSLLAAALVSDGRRLFLGGLTLAAALNIKLIPLVLLPALALLLRDARGMMTFGAGLTLGLAPFLPPVIAAGEAFYRNAIAYQPRSDSWGILFMLSPAFDLPGLGSWLRSTVDGYTKIARYVIMASSLGLGLWARRSNRSAVELAALVFAAFLFLTPAIGVQYLVFLVPVLVMTDLRRAAIWGFVAGLFVSGVYVSYGHGWFPFRSLHTVRPLPLSIGLVGLLAWLLLLEFLRSRLRQNPQAPPCSIERVS